MGVDHLDLFGGFLIYSKMDENVTKRAIDILVWFAFNPVE